MAAKSTLKRLRRGLFVSCPDASNLKALELGSCIWRRPAAGPMFNRFPCFSQTLLGLKVVLCLFLLSFLHRIGRAAPLLPVKKMLHPASWSFRNQSEEEILSGSMEAQGLGARFTQAPNLTTFFAQPRNAGPRLSTHEATACRGTSSCTRSPTSGIPTANKAS